MEVKRERTVAYSLAIALFIVGIVCYAAFPYNTPEQPVRIMLKSTAKAVLFDHKEHASEDGYALACEDCHHMWEEDEGKKPESCGECHTAEGEYALKRSDAFHMQCMGCHEDFGMGPVECSECHVF